MLTIKKFTFPQAFIHTGSGAQKKLTDNKIDGILAAMRPALRKGDYGGAVEQAVVDIGLRLADPDAGHAVDWFALIFFGVIGLLFFKEWRKWRMRRKEQRDCTRLLDKLKKEQEGVRHLCCSCETHCNELDRTLTLSGVCAQVRERKWDAVSCPICLEVRAVSPCCRTTAEFRNFRVLCLNNGICR